MIQAIDKKGFHATEITEDNKEEIFAASQTALHDEAETKKKNFYIALVLSLPVFITDMGAHLIPGFGDWLHSMVTARALAYFQFVLTTLRSEEHTSELQSRFDLVCRLLLEK